jgi:hypothetical protein
LLAGPLDTLLLGNSLVALTGALAEPSPDEVALEHLARAVPPGRTAVVAEVAESDPGLVDEALAGLSVRIVRRPLGEVEAELDAERHAVAAAGEEARRVLRATRPAPDGPPGPLSPPTRRQLSEQRPTQAGPAHRSSSGWAVVAADSAGHEGAVGACEGVGGQPLDRRVRVSAVAALTALSRSSDQG